MTTFAIATLGCKVNTYESQNYLECLKEAGSTEVDFREKADIYVINTCSVTNTAAAKSRQKIHQARRQNPWSAAMHRLPTPWSISPRCRRMPSSARKARASWRSGSRPRWTSRARCSR
ncbi:MAG: hypothetical protein ACLTCB_04335 [Merdibacter sp.]